MRSPRLLLALALSCVTWSSLARADGILPDAATPVQREQAQSRFVRGRDLMAKKKYVEALAEFRASHDIVASPNTRLEMARCLRNMGKVVAAYAELGRTAVEAKEVLAQDNRYQRAYDSAIAERADIQPKLGFVTLTIRNATDDTKVTVDGEDLRRAAWSEPVPVAPEAAEVVVTTPGHASVHQAVALAAGQRSAVTIDALSADPVAAAPVAASSDGGGSGLRPWAYVAGGVGVAGLATFGVFAVLAKSTFDDLNNTCHGGPCPPDKSGEVSSGQTQQTVANVGLVVGLVGAAASVTLFLVSSPGKSDAAPAAGLELGPGWAGVRGRF